MQTDCRFYLPLDKRYKMKIFKNKTDYVKTSCHHSNI